MLVVHPHCTPMIFTLAPSPQVAVADVIDAGRIMLVGGKMKSLDMCPPALCIASLSRCV